MGINSYWYRGKQYHSFERGWLKRGVQVRVAQLKKAPKIVGKIVREIAKKDGPEEYELKAAEAATPAEKK